MRPRNDYYIPIRFRSNTVYRTQVRRNLFFFVSCCFCDPSIRSETTGVGSLEQVSEQDVEWTCPLDSCGVSSNPEILSFPCGSSDLLIQRLCSVDCLPSKGNIRVESYQFVCIDDDVELNEFPLTPKLESSTFSYSMLDNSIASCGET